MKTVKVQVASAEGGLGSDRRLPPGRLAVSTGLGDRYRLGHRPVGSHGSKSCKGRRARLNVQSGRSKLLRLGTELCLGMANRIS